MQIQAKGFLDDFRVSNGCFLQRGSAIARIVGSNVRELQQFATTVKMWVYEENVNGRKLTDIINIDHENVKYLPGYKLPENVVSACQEDSDMVEIK